MVALLVIDMQVGMFTPDTPRHDAEAVLQRITTVAQAVRDQGGTIIFVQHDGPEGDVLAPDTPGWQLLPTLERTDQDLIIRKTACDAFYDTVLADRLAELQVRTLIVTGCATDFCVDTTVRAAASRAFDVLVVADGHTTADRPHLPAVAIIAHHNWMWQHLILPEHPVQVVAAAQFVIPNTTSA